jgi:hypothetical protein
VLDVGDEEGFSHVRFTAAEEGDHYHGGFFRVVASRAEPVRVGVQAFPPLGAFGATQLRPGDTLTLSRRTVEDHLPFPALEGL